MSLANLDPIDWRILDLLSKDGRMSLQEISQTVGLSPTPVSRRIRQLETRGIISSYAAIIDEAALGYDFSVFVSVQLSRQVDQALVEFEKAIDNFPEVSDCWLMTGNRDYLLRVVTPDLASFEAFLTGKLTKVTGVSNIESSVSLRRVKTSQRGRP
ncbi:AsnC family transcriptional regulator [Oceanicola sp. 22II-s10i]|uniref:Lrp/AsnC family transcriptional regulator n=1 Tax=Oceanicola sp. 22II-s10i TaxID=1317116 RepID=UPI000B521E69|nr:Lrp/AsnC family transcriptional regulator [Oceanicola sp. 22II-s10i]OWU84960.1 AsnC family transcriptional regulator [Oceanicola sp. 22II-s10i]